MTSQLRYSMTQGPLNQIIVLPMCPHMIALESDNAPLKFLLQDFRGPFHKAFFQ